MTLALLVAAMAQATTQEIAFTGATELQLSGELMLPAGDGPFPAVLLLPGSGPTDRDGNQPPYLRTDLHKQIAEHLAKNGVATFRFDKRPAHVNMAKWPKSTDPAFYSEYFSFENHVADVEAAYKAMAGAKGVDPKRLAILGHSEGGLFACWEAPRLKPKAVVLAATAGDTMVSVLRYQIGRNLERPEVPAALREEITKANEETMKAIAETGKLPERVHPNLAALYNAAAVKLLRSYLTIDPTVPLAKYLGPVLVINGDKDVQVRATVDAPRLFAALKSRPNASQELAIVGGASHCFKAVANDTDPGFDGPVVPQVLAKLTEWLKKSLK
jgi:dienelactone hydrolase